ncbi:ABC transporter ATP-binding protein [Sporosarcina trichiuri]|uniref:ABC transporter ATP-binding protein n=1 Tax=Sporosarcina trichiuri TaxID=3056445 RepID=UPI0025B5EFD1|nr:ABC transporter ATP-binding protein [Sporosarcina sp. 0.2-SM1T-5]WJY27263.1 ATP-binding cassette domain-containing protein [Sporosarcina sp. 0.2-SM1T-5]
MTHTADPAVAIRNLRLKFPGEDRLLFRDLSFSVQDGEKVLLLGPSGCGKSTLLQVASGIVPNSFELPMKAETLELPDSWGFVFQDPDTQFCMPYVDEELAFVLENMSVPRSEMPERIRAALLRVGLQLADIHTPILELSQGMKQRLALASVLLMEPDVLFLDEPSALLDPEGTEQIWSSIRGAAADKTVVIVEHKIDQIASWIDRVVLFTDDGEILADGRPAAIFRDYKAELIRYGIWYPGVWEDYLASGTYRRLLEDRAEPGDLHAVRMQSFTGYRGKKPVIHVEEAAVRAGAWVAVLGKNGSGKSSLLLSMMQLLKTDGRLEVDGREIIPKKRRKSVPAGLSLVFQNPELQFVANSLLEELTVSMQTLPKDEAERRASDLLERFSLPFDGQRHPYQLSVGQKRRLSVATALTGTTDVLLLDEPTFGQDARNTFVMLEILEELRNRGLTIIMVTHDLTIADRFATDVWTVHDGELVSAVPAGGAADARLVHA